VATEDRLEAVHKYAASAMGMTAGAIARRKIGLVTINEIIDRLEKSLAEAKKLQEALAEVTNKGSQAKRAPSWLFGNQK
jgi:hypothetical protein|tara:strand:- start:463 stop:699 length:237 start_codon:yes stop_codon:yes gene_type:complete